MKKLLTAYIYLVPIGLIFLWIAPFVIGYGMYWVGYTITLVVSILMAIILINLGHKATWLGVAKGEGKGKGAKTFSIVTVVVFFVMSSTAGIIISFVLLAITLWLIMDSASIERDKYFWGWLSIAIITAIFTVISITYVTKDLNNFILDHKGSWGIYNVLTSTGTNFKLFNFSTTSLSWLITSMTFGVFAYVSSIFLLKIIIKRYDVIKVNTKIETNVLNGIQRKVKIRDVYDDEHLISELRGL